jgi:hypothetical protein
MIWEIGCFGTVRGRRNQQFQHNARAINAVLHAHSLAGQTLIEARTSGVDPYQAIQTSIRKVEKRTRLRAQWKHENEVEHFFDYVLKRVTTYGENN